MLRSFTLAASAASTALLLLAGCASDGPTAKGPATMQNGALVAPGGMTLYQFDRDTAGSGKSACNGPCAALWPPMMASATDQPSGNYSIFAREDGTKQWAYKGKPIYTYKPDAKPGDRTGDNFRDVWHIIKE